MIPLLDILEKSILQEQKSDQQLGGARGKSLEKTTEEYVGTLWGGIFIVMVFMWLRMLDKSHITVHQFLNKSDFLKNRTV